MTREERLEKKRIAERLRYQKIKNDKDKYAQQKVKEREKYEKKKEKGVIKTVNQMTPREQRKARKVWREKAKNRRHRLALQDISNAPETPPCSDNEDPPQPPQNINRRAQAAQQKSIRARKARNLIIRKQEAEIAQLKSAVQRYKKQIQRIKKPPIITPNTKVNLLTSAVSAADKETIKKKLLFSEVITQQLNENFSNIDTAQEKRVFRRVLSGKIVKKYNVLPEEMKIKPLSKIGNKLKLMDTKRSSKKHSQNLKTCIVKFMEDDSNSRVCAGKKDFITKMGERKQKRVMLDTLFNLHKRFLEKTHIKISYSVFCKLRPFWVVQPRCDSRNTCMCVIHSNIDLMLKSLHNAKIISVSNYVDLLNQVCCNRFNEKCLSRECKMCLNKGLHYKEFDNSIQLFYSKWQSVRQDIVDLKTQKPRTVTKCVKSSLQILPRDLILDLESKMDKFLNHERNIVHQHQTIKTKKESLTESEALIHVDFSENYLTKYAEEVQSFHFGGSRQQISMHTVVVYTKDVEQELKSQCYCTLSQNLSHSPPAIWAHLQPILDCLPTTITTLHFLSDGPVTQYRNKMMFKVLATMLEDFYSNLQNFTWNFHEAGHGKGAPDGVGATCKRTADRLVASGTDISSIDDLAKALEKSCPNIKIFTVDDANISEKAAKLGSTEDLKTFSGTLKVHQITGCVLIPNCLIMKSLSCFCDSELCRHFHLGTLDYRQTQPRLCVDDIYGASDLEDEPLINQSSQERRKKLQKTLQHSVPASIKSKLHIDNLKPSTSGKETFCNGDFLLVKLQDRKTEYRYVAMCTGVEEDDELQVKFCKIFDETGKKFRINDEDISFITWDQVLKKLPAPNLKMRGQRIFYSFNEYIDVFERGF